MALFEFEDGRLVPAQFGYPVAQDLGPDLVDAICQQVLQIVSRPLFPVTWRDMTGHGDEETPRLTALDVSGQIVSVEILKELDSETLITSLSRLAEVASISWADLAAEYPSGPDGFRAGWAHFRDSMPPAVGPGPRLVMVAGDIDQTVRPALSILATSGVEVHLMNLRQMSNGRLFLDVNAVGPRLYGHAPQLLGSASRMSELTSGPELDLPASDATSIFEAVPAPAESAGETDAEIPTTRPTPKVSPHLRNVFSYPMSEEPPAPWQPTSDNLPQAPADAQDESPREETDERGEAPSQQDGETTTLQEEASTSGDLDANDTVTREEPSTDGVDDEETPADIDDCAQAADESGDTGQEVDGEQAAAPEPTAERDEKRWERPPHLGRRASRRAQPETSELNDAGATEAATASSVDCDAESAEVTQAREQGLPVLSRDDSGLTALADILGEDTPLVARSDAGIPENLMLARSGELSCEDGTYSSLEDFLSARELDHIDPWTQLRIGDNLGPTLAEALDEINREIVRESSHTPRARRAARH